MSNKYKLIPVDTSVEAEQIPALAEGVVQTYHHAKLHRLTSGVSKQAGPGDWIVKNAAGGIVDILSDVAFKAKYMPVSDSSTTTSTDETIGNASAETAQS